MLKAWNIEIPEDGLFDMETLPEGFIDTLHAVNKHNHGVYNDFDRLYAQDNALFRLFLQFRKWIIPTYRSRYAGIIDGEYRIDYESGTIERGWYREFGEYIYNSWRGFKELPKFAETYNSLTDVQKEGVKRSMVDLVAFTTFAAMVYMLKPGDEEEEEDMSNLDWTIIYELSRLRGELGAYLPGLGLKDQMRVINNPFAASPVINDFLKLFQQVFEFTPDKDGNVSIFQVYQRDSGMNEKGDYKIAGRFSKLNFLDNIVEMGSAEDIYENFEAASR
jgi:hypothetical protein